MALRYSFLTQTHTSPYNAIYEAGINKDLEKLEEALQKVSINVQHGNYTPVSQLAFEHKGEAVEFLLKFGASKIEAAYGYALGGFQEEVVNLLSRVALEDYSRIPFCLEKIAFALAKSNRTKLIEDFFVTVQIDYSEHIFSVLEAIGLGYGEGNHKDEAIAFWEKNDKIYSKRSESIKNKILSGFASTLTELEFQDFFTSITNSPLTSDLYIKYFTISKLKGLARIGNAEQINIILPLLIKKNPSEIPNIVDVISITLASHGFLEEVNAFSEKIIKNFPDLTEGVLISLGIGIARAGYIDATYQFLIKTKDQFPKFIETAQEAACVGVGENGNLKEIYALLEFIKNTKDITNCLFLIATSLAKKGYRKILFQFIEEVSVKHPTSLDEFFMGIGISLIENNLIKETLEFISFIKQNFFLKFVSVVKYFVGALAKNGEMTPIYKLLKEAYEEFPEQRMFASHNSNNPLLFKKLVENVSIGLVAGNQNEMRKEFVIYIKKHHPTLISSVIEGVALSLASSGKSTEFFDFLALIKIESPEYFNQTLERGATGFALKDKSSAYQFFETCLTLYPESIHIITTTIAVIEKITNICIDKEVVLKALTSIPDEKECLPLAVELKTIFALEEKNFPDEYKLFHIESKEEKLTYDPILLLPLAEKRRALMVKEKINYNQMSVWINPQAAILLLQSVSFMASKKIPESLFLSIFQFLAPVSPAEAKDLTQKLLPHYYKSRTFLFSKPISKDSHTSSSSSCSLPQKSCEELLVLALLRKSINKVKGFPNFSSVITQLRSIMDRNNYLAHASEEQLITALAQSLTVIKRSSWICCRHRSRLHLDENNLTGAIKVYSESKNKISSSLSIK